MVKRLVQRFVRRHLAPALMFTLLNGGHSIHLKSIRIGRKHSANCGWAGDYLFAIHFPNPDHYLIECWHAQLISLFIRNRAFLKLVNLPRGVAESLNLCSIPLRLTLFFEQSIPRRCRKPSCFLIFRIDCSGDPRQRKRQSKIFDCTAMLKHIGCMEKVSGGSCLPSAKYFQSP